mgnify:CR=1 FL=1
MTLVGYGRAVSFLFFSFSIIIFLLDVKSTASALVDQLAGENSRVAVDLVKVRQQALHAGHGRAGRARVAEHPRYGAKVRQHARQAPPSRLFGQRQAADVAKEAVGQDSVHLLCTQPHAARLVLTKKKERRRKE